MKRILYALLFSSTVVATPLGVNAQTEDEPKPCPLFEGVAEGHFKALIEGKSVTLPCTWGELERLGWRFAKPPQSEEMLAPLSNVKLLSDRDFIQVNTRTGQVQLMFCNTDSVEQPRNVCLVYGMQTWIPEQNDFYAFELPGGIRGGVSSEKEVAAAYGKVSYVLGVNTGKSYKRLLSYTPEAEMPSVWVQIITDEKGERAGIVTGFIARTEGIIGRYIADNPGQISDDEADNLVQRNYMKDRLKKAFSRLEQSKGRDKAEIAEKQREIGDIYYHGFQDSTEGFRWYLRAAEGGDQTAQYNVGICYNNGSGVEQNLEESVKWYTAAAEQGEADAMNNLGYAYEYGEGVEKDLAKSLEWYERAGEAGSEQAMLNCAYFHLQGRGGKENPEAGYAWAQKAMREQYVPVYVVLGYCYHYGKGVDKNIDTARHWYEIACNTGDKTALYNMGVIYYNGEGVKRDYDKAFEYFSKADETDLMAQLALAECYFRGRGTEKDPEKAAGYYRSGLQELDGRDGELSPEEQKIRKEIVRLLGGKLRKFE